MEPVILALEEKYDDKVAFIIVDVDDPDAKELLAQFQITGVPSFVYIDKNGTVVGEDVGGKSLVYLERIVSELVPAD